MNSKRPASGRTAILAAATELIRTNGVDGTSIADVIAASGTSAGAIYHHFGSKERLVVEVGRAALAAPMEMILNTSTELSPADLFAAALNQVNRDERTPQLLLQIWAGAQANPNLAALIEAESAQIRTLIATLLGNWCRAHSPATFPEHLAGIIMGLIAGFAVQRSLGLIQDADGYRETGVAMLSTLAAVPVG